LKKKKKKKKKRDKFSVWVLFANKHGCVSDIEISMAGAGTSLIAWMINGLGTFVKCIQLNNWCSSAMLSQSIIKKKKL